MSDQRNSQMFSEREAAAVLRVSLSTMRRWRHDKLGPRFFKLGEIIRYDTESLDRFREQHMSGA